MARASRCSSSYIRFTTVSTVLMDSVRDAAGAVDVEKVAAGTVGEVGIAVEADVGAGV